MKCKCGNELTEIKPDEKDMRKCSECLKCEANIKTKCGRGYVLWERKNLYYCPSCCGDCIDINNLSLQS